MVSYIFIVAILNIGLGFGVAIYLGRRYQALVAGGGFWSDDPGFAESGYQAAPPDEDAAAGISTLLDELQDESDAAAVADEPSAEAESAAPDAAQAEESPTPQLPPEEEHEKSRSETCVGDFQAGVEQFHDQLKKADDELRNQVETPDAAATEACLSSLMAATQEYLASRGKAYEVFHETHAEQSEFEGVDEDLRVAIERQDGQIENAAKAIEAFDYESDLAEACRQMIGETSKLIGTNHGMRDALDGAMVEVARHEQHLGTVGPGMQHDDLTGISNRMGLEASLFDWWEKDPQRMRLLSVAMIDVDRFNGINEEHGCDVGNKILRAVSRELESECRGESKVARFSGQRFFFLFPDSDTRAATNMVERIRQLVEMIHFHYRELEIQIAVSCAVTEAGSEDTSNTLVARTEAALQEAKRYGRNRTFLHEGKNATPVVPPNFSLEDKHITL